MATNALFSVLNTALLSAAAAAAVFVPVLVARHKAKQARRQPVRVKR